jgi:hypothetical protein
MTQCARRKTHRAAAGVAFTLGVAVEAVDGDGEWIASRVVLVASVIAVRVDLLARVEE